MTQHQDKKYWFKTKRYGYGWRPSSWEGWLTVLIFLVLLFLGALLFNPETPAQIPYFVGYTLIVALLLIYVSYKKGEKPRWRWGKEDEDSLE